MKASELIVELQKAIDKNGDLELRTIMNDPENYGYDYSAYDIHNAYYMKEVNKIYIDSRIFRRSNQC